MTDIMILCHATDATTTRQHSSDGFVHYIWGRFPALTSPFEITCHPENKKDIIGELRKAFQDIHSGIVTK